MAAQHMQAWRARSRAASVSQAMSSPSDTRAAPGLAHAALLGLGLGLLLGGLMLVGYALRGLLSDPDCTGLLPLECDAERQSLAVLGRLQAMAGTALALLSLAVFLLLRKRQAAAQP
jgi:hypothetical protein